MRRGHITSAQRNTWGRLMATWSVPFRNEHLDFKALFGREGRVILEIGFGMGETTAAMARANPSWNFLGVEVYRPGVGALLGRIEKEAINNIRIIEQDVVEVLAEMIPNESLDAVHIYFPDPWPKKRHHKRRLIQPEFLAALSQKLTMGGVVHMASDWPDYARQMLEVGEACKTLRNQAGKGFADRPEWRPLTKFEARGMRLGHPVADLLFEKITPQLELERSAD